MEQTKKCMTCGEEKPLTEFYRNKHMKDGHTNECKRCRSEKQKMKRKQLSEAAAKNGIGRFTARELMEELAKRGYRGKLEYTQVTTIDITNF